MVKRFQARLDELSTVDGFEGFELLKPTGEAETRWFVYTRWRDEDAYQAWRNSDTFSRGHAGQGEDAERPQPLSTGATLLEFDVTLSASPVTES